jgi:hypothetical protein
MALERLQKKNETLVVCEVGLINSLMIPQSNIVLPLPGSPLIHGRRLCWSFRHCWKSEFFFEDPVVRVSEEATLILLDAVLVVAGVGRLQVLQTGSVLSISHASIHLFAAPRWSRETSMSSCVLTRKTVESSARILCLQSKFLQCLKTAPRNGRLKLRNERCVAVHDILQLLVPAIVVDGPSEEVLGSTAIEP